MLGESGAKSLQPHDYGHSYGHLSLLSAIIYSSLKISKEELHALH